MPLGNDFPILANDLANDFDTSHYTVHSYGAYTTLQKQCNRSKYQETMNYASKPYIYLITETLCKVSALLIQRPFRADHYFRFLASQVRSDSDYAVLDCRLDLVEYRRRAQPSLVAHRLGFPHLVADVVQDSVVVVLNTQDFL